FRCDRRPDGFMLRLSGFDAIATARSRQSWAFQSRGDRSTQTISSDGNGDMTPAARGVNSPRVLFCLMLGFAIVVLTIPIGRAPVWEPNNARWILLARDMVEHGHWLMPEIRGVPNEGLYKPQLFAWAIALASLRKGAVTEPPAAIPPLVSALAGIVAVFAIGRHLWGVRAGVLAGLILTTTLNYFVFAQQSLADVMMAAAMVWALYFLLR